MGLEYDFDIVAIAPDEVDPEHAMTAVTGTPPARARFRDVKTADALRGASPKIRRIFEESGFSLETCNSGFPSGIYASDQSDDRARVLDRLFRNIRNIGVQGEYCGEFDFWEFLDHVRTAQAQDGLVLPKAPVAPQQKPDPIKPPDRRSVPGRIGFALGLAVVLFSMLKYLAAQGATP